MSAFMVSKSHIDGLVHAAYFGPRDVRGLPQSGDWRKPQFKGCHNWAFEQMNDVGEMLVKENLSSIHAPAIPTHSAIPRARRVRSRSIGCGPTGTRRRRGRWESSRP